VRVTLSDRHWRKPRLGVQTNTCHSHNHPHYHYSMLTIAPSISPDQRRMFLIGAAAAAAIALTITIVRLASSSTDPDKPLSKRQLARLSPAERRILTTTLRERADVLANAEEDPDFTRAAELYTRALAAAAQDADRTVLAALYTSRAWCYANVIPPRHKEVVRDCDAAIKLDPRDAMAVLRRSVAVQELKATGAL